MISKNFDVVYEGNLQTTLTHIESGSVISTDAPVDNNGKGSQFSPTDMVASALCSCMLTVVGIYFQKKGRDLSPINCAVQKVMEINPRRISKIHVEFDFGANHFSEDELETINRLTINCPVANSLSIDLEVITNL